MMRWMLFLLLLISNTAASAVAAPIQEIKTPQGFTIWLVEDHALPIISAHISFTESGVAYDPSGKEGRTNMVAALLMEGAGDHDANQFNALLEAHAIRLNIGADDDRMLVMLSTLSEHKQRAFDLLADSLLRPRFDDDAITRTRNKMQSLLTEQSAAPSYKLGTLFQEKIYGAHPYARMGIGDTQSLNALTRNDFQDYVNRYLTRSNIVISIVGDITASEATQLIDTHFSALPAHYQPDSSLEDVTPPNTPDQSVLQHEMPQTMVAFGLAGLKRNDPDFMAAYVLNYIIGGNGLGSRLGKEIRVKHGLVYSVNTQLVPKQHAGVWHGMFATQNKNVTAALSQMRAVLEDIQQHGVTEAELQDAKTYLTGSFILDLSSNQEVANFLAMMQFQHLGIDYMDKRNSLIERVTLADIARVAKRVIDPSRLRIVMVGQPEL